MNKENYFKISGVIFIAIALLHAARLYYGWDAMVYGQTVPSWISWVALAAGGYLGYSGIKMGK